MFYWLTVVRRDLRYKLDSGALAADRNKTLDLATEWVKLTQGY